MSSLPNDPSFACSRSYRRELHMPGTDGRTVIRSNLQVLLPLSPREGRTDGKKAQSSKILRLVRTTTLGTGWAVRDAQSSTRFLHRVLKRYKQDTQPLSPNTDGPIRWSNHQTTFFFLPTCSENTAAERSEVKRWGGGGQRHSPKPGFCGSGPFFFPAFPQTKRQLSCVASEETLVSSLVQSELVKNMFLRLKPLQNDFS